MNQLIIDFISSKRTVVVSMLRSGKKSGNIASNELKSKEHEIFPVHPDAPEIDGLTCYPDLKSLSGKVDGLLISIASQNVPPELEEAAQTGLKNIWLQQGAWSKEVQKKIDQLKIPVASKKCIIMYAPPVKSEYKFHRPIDGIFGVL